RDRGGTEGSGRRAGRRHRVPLGSARGGPGEGDHRRGGQGTHHVTSTAPAKLRAGWLAVGLVAVLVAVLAGLALGPVRLSPLRVAAQRLDLLPGADVHSGLSPTEAAIVTELRLPRVVLGLLVGATLAMAGGTYQGVFRNPLADPYLLGVAAGAGLGATIAIAGRGAFAGLPARRRCPPPRVGARGA